MRQEVQGLSGRKTCQGEPENKGTVLANDLACGDIRIAAEEDKKVRVNGGFSRIRAFLFVG